MIEVEWKLGWQLLRRETREGGRDEGNCLVGSIY